MKINFKDMDHDSGNDVGLFGKGGAYVMYNQGSSPTGKPVQLLTLEAAFTSSVEWSRPENEFETTFNGKDLSGWDGPAESWKVKDGVPMRTGRTDSKMLNVNYLRTRKTYGDYALEFDYRVPTGNANSRALIRTEKRDDPVQAGIEIQSGNLGGHPITNHVVGGQNKFNRTLKEFAREDFIGFQDHGTPAEYRNIRIKELGD